MLVESWVAILKKVGGLQDSDVTVTTNEEPVKTKPTLLSPFFKPW